jgi:hypothetical protein
MRWIELPWVVVCATLFASLSGCGGDVAISGQGVTSVAAETVSSRAAPTDAPPPVVVAQSCSSALHCAP